jgi:hypothetical protein
MYNSNNARQSLPPLNDNARVSKLELEVAGGRVPVVCQCFLDYLQGFLDFFLSSLSNDIAVLFEESVDSID